MKQITYTQDAIVPNDYCFLHTRAPYQAPCAHWRTYDAPAPEFIQDRCTFFNERLARVVEKGQGITVRRPTFCRDCEVSK